MANVSSLSSTARSFADNAADTGSDLMDKASRNLSDASDKAAEMASDARERVGEQVGAARSSSADAVAGFAKTVRDAAGNFEDQSPQVAGMVRSAADGVEKLSNEIRDRDIGDLVNAVTDFTKRRPAVALGLGVLAGVLITRFLMSQSEA